MYCTCFGPCNQNQKKHAFTTYKESKIHQVLVIHSKSNLSTRSATTTAEAHLHLCLMVWSIMLKNAQAMNRQTFSAQGILNAM